MNRNKQRKLIMVLVVLVSAPSIISGMVWSNHGKFVVGIVLEEGLDPSYAEVAREGLLLHGDYFEPRILYVRFNSSEVRTNGRYYLSKDFNDPVFSKDVRTEYDVHAVLIITDHPLWNWIDNPRVFWGEACLRSASAVMTVSGVKKDTVEGRIHIMHVAVHEVSHLLGYLHETADPECVMQYAGNGLNYSFFKSFELPYRVVIAPIALEKDTWVALFLINSILMLMFIPYAVAILIVIRILLARYQNVLGPTSLNIVRDATLSFFVMMVAASVLVGMLFAIPVVILANLLVYFGSIVLKSKKTEK